MISFHFLTNSNEVIIAKENVLTYTSSRDHQHRSHLIYDPWRWSARILSYSDEISNFIKPFTWDWRDSTVDRALALHKDDMGSIPGTQMCPWTLPGVILEWRARSKLWAPVVAPKQIKKTTKMTFTGFHITRTEQLRFKSLNLFIKI